MHFPPDPGSQRDAVQHCMFSAGSGLPVGRASGLCVILPDQGSRWVQDFSNCCTPQFCLGFQWYGTTLFRVSAVRHKIVRDFSGTPPFSKEFSGAGYICVAF